MMTVPAGRVALNWVLATTMFVVAASAPAAGKSQRTARGEAGRIEVVEGRVTVTDADGRLRPVRVGDALYEGDVIATDADGELHAELSDGGVIAVRPASQLRIVRHRADGGQADTCVFNLAKGSFRSITGWIAMHNPDKYRITAGTATIGVRGTDHEPLVIPSGSGLGEPGTYDRVHAGATRLRGASGVVHVTQGRVGFHAAHGKARPHLLDGVPHHFRAGRHDHRLEGRHARVGEAAAERRVERRARLAQQRSERSARSRQEQPR